MRATMTFAVLVTAVAACAPTPADIKFDKEVYILEGRGAKGRIQATVVDEEGTPITEGVSLTFFCPNTDVVKVAADGRIEAVSSGEDTVEVEVVDAPVKKTVKVRVKIPAEVKVSHEKLRLWTGQVKKNVSAWVVSEKGAYIEGYLPTWSSQDPSIVSVKAIPDPTPTKYKRSYVELRGEKSGETYITASFQGISTDIKVRVYDEDEEVDLAGRRISKEGEKKPEK